MYVLQYDGAPLQTILYSKILCPTRSNEFDTYIFHDSLVTYLNMSLISTELNKDQSIAFIYPQKMNNLRALVPLSKPVAKWKSFSTKLCTMFLTTIIPLSFFTAVLDKYLTIKTRRLNYMFYLFWC